MHKYQNDKLPPCFTNLFNYNRDVHTYNTRNRHRLRQPRIKTKMAEIFITNMGPLLWNQLEGKLDKNTNLGMFKKNMIGLLLESYD